jgi:hypothetical protein
LDDQGEDCQYLLSELEELELEKIERIPAGPAPDGARGAGLAEFGALAITLVSSPVLGSLLNLVQDWLARRRSGTITMSLGEDRLELTAVPTDLQREAMAAFLARHQE